MKKLLVIAGIIFNGATSFAGVDVNVLCSADFIDSNSNTASFQISITQNSKLKFAIVAKSLRGIKKVVTPISSITVARLTKGMPTIDYDVVVDLLQRSGRTDVLPVDYFDAHSLKAVSNGKEKMQLVWVDAFKNNKVQYSFLTDMSTSYGFCKKELK